MKRIISLILLLAILGSAFPVGAMVSDPGFNDTNGYEYYYTAAMELASRGIVTGYPDGSFGADNNISRAEMATVICRMIGLEGNALVNTESTCYSDVAMDYWALGYINLATDKKIINGDGTGNFRPLDNVTYQEAIKLVVCAAGYDNEVVIDQNDWSLGYINVANAKGITKNIVGKKDEALTRGDVAVLVYNAVKLMDEKAEIQKQNAQKLDELNADEEPGLYYEETGQLSGFVGNFYDEKVTDGDDAKASLELLKDYIGIKNVDTELEFVRSYESGDFVIYVMNQIYKGLTVYGHEVRVKTDKDGNCVSVISGFLLVDAINIKPGITKENAVATAEAQYAGYVAVKDSAELVIYADANEEPYLAYILELTNDSDFNNYCAVVDAHSGEIKEFYSMGETFAQDDQGIGEDVGGDIRAYGVEKRPDSKYALVDNERKITTVSSDYDPAIPGKVYTQATKDYDPTKDSDQNGDGYKDFQLALTAHANVAAVFDYYRDVHNHTYINNDASNPKGVEVVVPLYEKDDNGGKTKNVHRNAYASYEKMKTDNVGILAFGISGGYGAEGIKYNYATAMDIVAHEFTHLVFNFKAPTATSKHEGLVGAIKEAYSDIMGELFEAYMLDRKYPDWKHGDSVYFKVKRNIMSPYNGDCPWEYEGTYFVNPDLTDKAHDYGGVHTNSTVISHAAYIMNEFIPTETLAKLWYKSMDNYGNICDFTQVRNAVLAAADELKMSDDEKKVIKDAFTKVGIEETTPYVTISVVEAREELIPIEGATIEIKSGVNLKGQTKNLIFKTGADGKIKVRYQELPYIISGNVKKEGYLDRNLQYNLLRTDVRNFVISLFKYKNPSPSVSDKWFEGDDTTITIYHNDLPLYSISNVIERKNLGQQEEPVEDGENSYSVIVNNQEFECRLPVTVTMLTGETYFEIMDWTPSVQTGHTMDVGFIMPDSCPSVEAYESDETGQYSWDIKPGTTYTIDQPGYYHVNYSYGTDEESILYFANIKIFGERKSEPSHYRDLENSYMYDEQFYNDMFKYGTDTPIVPQGGYYNIGGSRYYKIYPDGTNPQGATFSIEPMDSDSEIFAGFTVFGGNSGALVPQPGFITAGTYSLNNGEVAILTHIDDAKISAEGVKVVSVSTEGVVVPQGRKMMFEAEKNTTISLEGLYPFNYTVYNNINDVHYNTSLYSGSKTSTSISLKAGQCIKVEAVSQNVIVKYPDRSVHFTAYLSK